LRLWYWKTNKIVSSLENIEYYLKVLLENTPYNVIPDPDMIDDDSTDEVIFEESENLGEVDKPEFSLKDFLNKKIF
jgi:hypothetical protein